MRRKCILLLRPGEGVLGIAKSSEIRCVYYKEGSRSVVMKVGINRNSVPIESFVDFNCGVCGDKGGETWTTLGVAVCR